MSIEELKDQKELVEAWEDSQRRIKVYEDAKQELKQSIIRLKENKQYNETASIEEVEIIEKYEELIK